MALNKFNRKYFSNIKTSMPYVETLRPEMIIKRELIGTKGKRDPQPVYDWKMNQEFWIKQKEPMNIVLDEVHNMMDSRRSMSKANVIMGNFMALLRRVLGAQHGNYGELVLITQLLRRVDIIALELASEIRYHIMHYSKKCKDCGQEWRENTEMPEGYYRCIRCGSMELIKFKHRAEIYRFRGMNEYQNWRDFQEKSWFHHYMVNDIEKYFGLYETLQWSNLFESVYD
jgi:DNA-directed RNA polymerase subunit RPC12/RpoP